MLQDQVEDIQQTTSICRHSNKIDNADRRRIEMTEDTRVDNLLRKVKNNKWMSLIIFCGISFVALASLVKAMEETGALITGAISRTSAGIQYDNNTREALIAVSRDIDVFLLSISTSSQNVKLESVATSYVKIKADLMTILLRNNARPLNDATQRITTSILNMWSGLEPLLRDPEGLSPTAARITLGLISNFFVQALTMEDFRNEKHAPILFPADQPASGSK
jgi:hypothetical protein